MSRLKQRSCFVKQLRVDQLEELYRLGKMSLPCNSCLELANADGLLLAGSGSQHLLVYISAKHTITPEPVAAGMKQTACCRQLLDNICITLEAGNLAMTAKQWW